MSDPRDPMAWVAKVEEDWLRKLYEECEAAGAFLGVDVDALDTLTHYAVQAR